ncbi:hypothetical protein C8J56DRAFT_1173570 [Mycena floridula]|nr:hypothetical protein C8J56DRAFT_1173570 [Mycena floridula]
MTANLELDPLDPLNLILHNTSQTGTSSLNSTMDSSRNSPDWSQLSSMWSSSESTETSKFNPALMDFDLSSLGMDLDFDPSMIIEPNALHYDNNLKTHYPYDSSYSMPDMMSFPFSFQTFNPPQEQQPRRLSVTSSSLLSGTSLSSPLETAPPSVHQHQPNVEDYSNDPAAALAHRVRESVGVMLAVPMNGQGQNHASLLIAQSQLDIPHPSISGPTVSPVVSTASAPPSQSSLSSAPSIPPPPPTNLSQTQSNAGIPRPKTSHTAVERRYRTNLNARIQSLRMAVPALRILENHAELGTNSGGGGRKVKVKVPASTKIKKQGEEEEEMDIVDERGFVDGVKVARKCSKANVLGKTVEYIRVLKKRENRLKREQAGLKSLVMGLVGGSGLLREWEREWKENFGGEEKDEIQDEDLEEPEGGSEDDVDPDDEVGEGRKRKKPRVTAKKEPVVREKKPVVPQAPTADGVIPEKRKRDRPRKQALPPVPVQPLAHDVCMQHQPITQDSAHQQYLLATFALFSFFNSPLTSPSYSYSPHSTTGTVLSSHPAIQAAWGWREAIQAFHLLVSFFVFVSIALPWLPVSKPGFSFPWPKSTDSSAQHRVSPAGETLHESPNLGKNFIDANHSRNQFNLSISDCHLDYYHLSATSWHSYPLALTRLVWFIKAAKEEGRALLSILIAVFIMSGGTCHFGHFLRQAPD